MLKKDLDRIAGFLREESALCFAGRREAALRRHLQGRMERLGVDDPLDYLDLLTSSAGERGDLYSLVTVNETSFFRNQLQFLDLKTSILPELEEARNQRPALPCGTGDRFRKLRFLSAACSTGEEPYSLAMTVLEALRYPLAWDIEIVAGDLSEECLRTAREGRYPEARIKGIPPAYRDKYLRKDHQGWVVKDEVKRLIRFTRLNLAEVMAGGSIPGTPKNFAGFDLIFCRNVMIYFPLERQQLLIDGLQRLLVPGGYLLTGDAEPLHLYRHELETVNHATSLIYRKRRAAKPPREETVALLAALTPPPVIQQPVASQQPSITLQVPPPVTRWAVDELLFQVAGALPGKRDEALAALAAIGLDTLAPVLEEGVRNNNEADLRNGAMEALVAFGEQAVPLLEGLLKDPDHEVRNFATVMLGNIGSPGAVMPLIAALDDPDLNVRHGAAESLGRIGDRRACRPLLDLLDQGFWLQFPAIAALGELGCLEAVPRLIGLLEEELLFLPVMQALGKIGDPAALPALREAALRTDPGRASLASPVIAALEKGGGRPAAAGLAIG
ncbi:HEAT repeat domain-containing protein [Geomonas sp. Red32]|uniref:CheR family methyltransferase n=1 Tax=Geomonas sp. Red32 TaxID=2912856 RepID=UPI00202CA96C|nr:CheR family methyltransferase [Geomonas sp. Red32]MCM0081102.1 HEAT repeat domain-containing protein [Geomonas sp. Red32]